MQVCCATSNPQTPTFNTVKPATVQNRFGFAGALLPAIEQAVLSTSVKSVGSFARVTDSFDGLSTRPAEQQIKQEAINLATIGAFTFGFRMLFKNVPNKYAEAGIWIAAYAVSETVSRVATVLTSEKHKAEATLKHDKKAHHSALQGSAMEPVVLPALGANSYASNNIVGNRQTLFGNNTFLTSNTGFAPNVVSPQAGQAPFSLPVYSAPLPSPNFYVPRTIAPSLLVPANPFMVA